MLKLVKSFDVPILKRNNISKSVFKKNNSNNKIIKFDIKNYSNIKLAKKSKKLENQKIL